jgi:hypothetical protein
MYTSNSFQELLLLLGTSMCWESDSSHLSEAAHHLIYPYPDPLLFGRHSKLPQLGILLSATAMFVLTKKGENKGQRWRGWRTGMWVSTVAHVVCVRVC